MAQPRIENYQGINEKNYTDGRSADGEFVGGAGPTQEGIQ
jgi:hypothetical protein